MKRVGLTALALLAGGCVHVAHFVPASSEQAVAGQPESAAAEQDGVRVVVHVGGWRGSPDDLQDRVTPVEVSVDNDSGHALRVAPEAFGLLGPNGFRYQPMAPQEVQRLTTPAYGTGGALYYYGLFGAYPWPGFYRPWHRYGFYPYSWWGWYGPPEVVYDVPPAPPRPPPVPRGTLENGGNISLLLFFPVPAQSLGSLEVMASFVDDSGKPVATLRFPLVRQGAGPPPPAPAAPPPGGDRAAAPPPTAPPPAAPPPPPRSPPRSPSP